MFCPYCGFSNEDDAVFCENCGKTLVEDGTQGTVDMNAQTRQYDASAVPVNPNDPPKKSSKAPIIIAVAAAVVVVVIVIVAMVMMGANNGGEQGSQGETTAVSPSAKSSSQATNNTHTVVFETNGGSQYESMTAIDGQVITSPVDPTKKSSTFGGWYADSACTKRVTFPYTVSSEDPDPLVFYAQWATTPGAAASNSGNSTYTNAVFPQSSSSYLTESELRNLSSDQIQRAINELYARHGYIFQSNMAEKAFFESQPWYRGTDTDQDRVKSNFNKYEEANLKLLQQYRDSHF